MLSASRRATATAAPAAAPHASRHGARSSVHGRGRDRGPGARGRSRSPARNAALVGWSRLRSRGLLEVELEVGGGRAHLTGPPASDLGARVSGVPSTDGEQTSERETLFLVGWSKEKRAPNPSGLPGSPQADTHRILARLSLASVSRVVSVSCLGLGPPSRSQTTLSRTGPQSAYVRAMRPPPPITGARAQSRICHLANPYG
jgi:hypothetical protein